MNIAKITEKALRQNSSLGMLEQSNKALVIKLILELCLAVRYLYHSEECINSICLNESRGLHLRLLVGMLIANDDKWKRLVFYLLLY